MIINKVVLLLKAQNDQSPFVDSFNELLCQNGYTLQNLHILDFEYVNLNIFKEKLDSPERYDGVIFSSPRCIEAAALALNGCKLNDLWLNKINYVVGESTYKLAEEKIGLCCVGKESGNANNLVNVILNNDVVKPSRLLYPCGNLSRDSFERLQTENIALDRVEVYRTCPSLHLDDEFAKMTDDYTNLAEYVVFFSPSGVQYVKALLKNISMNLGTVKFIAIGPTTEKAMSEANIPIAGVAEKPTPTDLFKVIQSLTIDTI